MMISYRSVWRVCLAVAIFGAIVFLAWRARQILGWIGAGFFFAVALNPAVERVAKIMPRRNRGLATGVVFLIILAIIGFVSYSLLPPLIEQTRQLVSNLPGYVNNLQHGHGALSDLVRKVDLVGRLKELESRWLSSLSVAGGSVVGIVKALFDSLAAVVSVLSITYFMITEGPTWMARFWSVQPVGRRHQHQKMVHEMYDAVTGYVSGNLLTALVVALATALILMATGIPYSIPLGLLMGLFDLLPLIGATLGAIVVVIVCLFNSVTAAIIVGVFFFIYQQIENHILRPLVLGRSVKMSPLMVIVSVLFGAVLDGIFGALIAIPVAASLQILIKDWLITHRRAINS